MSNIEQTLSIIKPDAVERNLQDEIKQEFINKGFKIKKEKKIHISNMLMQNQYLAKILGWTVITFPVSSFVFPGIKSKFDGGLILTAATGKPLITIIASWPVPRVFVTGPSEIAGVVDENENANVENQEPTDWQPRNLIKGRIKSQNKEGMTDFQAMQSDLSACNLLRNEKKWSNLQTYYREVDLEKMQGVNFMQKLERIIFIMTRI